MNTVFNPSYKTKETDLNIQIVDENGSLTDPYIIIYAIYKVFGRSSQQIISDLDLVPIRKELGIFYPEYKIPGDALGKYAIKWGVKLTPDSGFKVYVQEFTVIKFELGE